VLLLIQQLEGKDETAEMKLFLGQLQDVCHMNIKHTKK
jgi:hypothetical protein